MSDAVRVPYGEAESEFVEKRSRFISHIWRVESEEEAQAHIKAMKAQYYDAATTAGAISSVAAPSATATTASHRARRASPC